jgi:hypothetical protein
MISIGDETNGECLNVLKRRLDDIVGNNIISLVAFKKTKHYEY